MDVQPTNRLGSSNTNQHERFDWFVRRLEPWVDHYEIGDLEDFLYGEVSRPGQREKAVVLLALHEDRQARQVLEDFETSETSPAFRHLYRIALDHARS